VAARSGSLEPRKGPLIALFRGLERVWVRMGDRGFPLASILSPVGGEEILDAIFYIKEVLRWQSRKQD
jgi:hypothetical protein